MEFIVNIIFVWILIWIHCVISYVNLFLTTRDKSLTHFAEAASNGNIHSDFCQNIITPKPASPIRHAVFGIKTGIKSEESLFSVFSINSRKPSLIGGRTAPQADKKLNLPIPQETGHFIIM
jgi:hypothetical protein